ncbi:putative membrane protein [Handroanthus impetiginosus]|uniref:Putative membrane protein n=1 Tax=Handroanthus impetiginosus TaxID=429701 RepID=A0A2G9HMK5_9LAMI|nr:putative membrane protein [Handroanthus impetiginosus]
MNSPNRGSGNGFFKAKIMETMKKAKKIGEDDPRKIFHCIKVGLALTFVSLFYYFRPLYDDFGQAGIWAVLTVVVVFEFTVGGTLSKGLNRGCATLVAGALGLGAEYLASLSGEKWKPVVLGLLVFILAAVSTFTRFFPNVKKRYDYGVLIFILTFSLVAVSGYQVTDVLQIAHQRLTTILIGGATCMMISIFICPVWAGLDLHNLVAGNIEKLAAFLEGFGSEVCNSSGDESSMVSSKNDNDKSYLQGYKSMLNSKAAEESLANFAWWEPRHGHFGFHHPWNQYLKIGVLARECAYQIEALSGCMNSKPKVASEFQLKIQVACKKMSTELGKALKESASSMKNMTFSLSIAGIHIQNSKATADELARILENSSLTSKVDLHEIMPTIVIVSALIDIVKCVEKILVSVDELCQKAHFQKSESTTTTSDKLLHHGIVTPINDDAVIEISKTLMGNSIEKNKHNYEIDDIANNDDQIVVEISRTLVNSLENCKNSHLFEKL